MERLERLEEYKSIIKERRSCGALIVSARGRIRFLQEAGIRQVDGIGEAIVEAAGIMIFNLILVIGPYELAAHIPDEGFERVVQTVLSHIPHWYPP